MKCEVLVSTMNKDNVQNLIKKMKLKKCTIINQVTNIDIPSSINTKNDQKIITVQEKGLSKSRNKAIDNSESDICIIADDDMYYMNDYEEIILDAYKKYPDADLIAFIVPHENRKGKKILKEGRVSFLNSQKIQSVQLSFKRSSIVENNIRFDENFGAGAKYFCGEENIFMNDCFKKGLKLYFFPKKIAILRDTNESTWFNGYNKKYFISKGAIYRRMSKRLFSILILQFAIRKYFLYKNSVNIIKAIKYMFEGAEQYRKEFINEKNTVCR